jgi:hypothetical protein
LGGARASSRTRDVGAVGFGQRVVCGGLFIEPLRFELGHLGECLLGLPAPVAVAAAAQLVCGGAVVGAAGALFFGLCPAAQRLVASGLAVAPSVCLPSRSPG